MRQNTTLESRKALDTETTRKLLAAAARQLRHPIVIVKETEETEQLRKRVATLEKQLARRTRLEDATIRQGAPRYETGTETPVIALVGCKFSPRKKPWWKLW